jgi:ubiquinone biosynthesis accessory factor UbiJ
MIEQAAIIALNHLLRDAQWARERLAPLAGRTTRVFMPPLRLEFAINPDGTLSEAATEQPDVVIALPPQAPLYALRGADALLQQARITGSAELADTLGFVLRNLGWDYEEDLSQLVGDIAAHRIAAAVRRFAAWQRDAVRNTAENVAEYLREETTVLTARALASEFAGAVDALRDDLARLEKRIERLEGGSSGL